MHLIKISFFFLIFLSLNANANEARNWLNQEIDIIISAYKNTDLPNENKFLMVENTINNNFAGTGIAKFVAGKSWNGASKEVKIEYNLKNSQICLLGFSQGCMMAINLGLISNENYNCIVGFSGKIINQKDLTKRKISATKIFLIHGDKDTVVSPTFLLEAKDFLIRNNVEVKTKIINNCEHHISVEASSEALNYIKNNFKI